MSGIFVGIGFGEYDNMTTLEHPVNDVEELGRLLETDFTGELLIDAEESSCAPALHESQGSFTTRWWFAGADVERSRCRLGGRLRLLAKDHVGDGSVGILPSDVSTGCVYSGANQLLLIVDACFSGQGLAETIQTSSALLQELQPAGEHAWVGVLVSSMSDARGGLFGSKLRHLLEHGPTTKEECIRWSRQLPFIRGEDLCNALLAEWEDEDQQPQAHRIGASTGMLRNPRYKEKSSATVVEHAADSSWFQIETTR